MFLSKCSLRVRKPSFNWKLYPYESYNISFRPNSLIFCFKLFFALSSRDLSVLQQLSKDLPFNQGLSYIKGWGTISFNMLFRYTTIFVSHLGDNFKQWSLFYLLLICYLPRMVSSLCLLGIKRIEMPHIQSQIYFSELIRVVFWKKVIMSPWIIVNIIINL